MAGLRAAADAVVEAWPQDRRVVPEDLELALETIYRLARVPFEGAPDMPPVAADLEADVADLVRLLKAMPLNALGAPEFEAAFHALIAAAVETAALFGGEGDRQPSQVQRRIDRAEVEEGIFAVARAVGPLRDALERLKELPVGFATFSDPQAAGSAMHRRMLARRAAIAVNLIELAIGKTIDLAILARAVATLQALSTALAPEPMASARRPEGETAEAEFAAGVAAIASAFARIPHRFRSGNHKT
ncbi:MAG: hypothetical protein C0606_05555 [Hyphomicrobiales bacterium]|nr:MAG: hypothetical protein C0606_05555 [Hyphomicrobiales bacterium]